jgi:hypothetical protein
MKLNIIFASIIYLLSVIAQQRKHSTSHHSKTLQTQFDLLQGTWADRMDTLNKIKFFNHNRLAIYDNKARLQDTLKFYLYDECVGTMEQLKNPNLTNGEYLNLYVSPRRFICHKIVYLTDEEFCYIPLGGIHEACFKRCQEFIIQE